MKTLKSLSMMCMALLLATALMAPFANAQDNNAQQEEIKTACEAQCGGDAECVKECIKKAQEAKDQVEQPEEEKKN